MASHLKPPEPYLTGRTSALKVEEIVNILRSPDESKTIQTAPATPQGGEVYLYKITSGMREDIWKDDKYHFRSDGTRKQPGSSPVVVKQYHKAYTEDKATTRAFVREASYLYNQPLKHVLVQYIGDHTQAQPAPQRKKRGQQTLHSPGDSKCRKVESTGGAVQSGVTENTNSNLDPEDHSSPTEMEDNGKSNTILGVTLNEAKVSETETKNDHDTNQKRIRTGDHRGDDDIDYLGTTSGSPVKKPRWQPQLENDNTIVTCVTNTHYAYLYTFLEEVERNRDVIRVVQHVLALSRFWNKDCTNKGNPCLSLIEEVNKNWNLDAIKARNWVKCSVNTDVLSLNQDRSVYINLIAAVLVGACHTRTEVQDFVKTLEDPPLHLQHVHEDIRLSRECTYTVGCYTIRGDVLSRLETKEWLTDEIMDTYLHLLEGEWCSRVSFHCLVLPTETILLWEAGQYTDRIRGEDENLTNYTWILMPVNMPRNQHWVLLVANVKDGTVGVVNSKPSLDVEDKVVEHWRLFVNHLKSTSKEGSKSWMKKQYPVIEQSDGHSCGIFVLMAADAILSEKSPGIMRNCHVEKYRLYVLQRILQYAKDKGDIQGGGNHMMAVDGQGNVTNEIQTVTLETRDVLENSCTMTTEQGGPTIHEEDGHETHEGNDCAVASDENTQDYPCLGQHLLHKQEMACLLVVALAENNLEERMLWAGSHTGTRVERETYKKYIVWALKVFDINEEEYTENMMKPILSQLAGCCLHHEAGSYRIRNHEVAIKLREKLLSDVRQLVERMDLEFIFRYVTSSSDPTEEEQLDVPFKIELKHDDLHIVAKRFATAVRDRKFAFVCMHSLFQVETFVNMVWDNLLHNLNKDRSEPLKVLSKNDIIYGYSFLFWASITDNSNLLKKALNSVQFKVKNRQEALFGSCFGRSLANFDNLCSKNNWKLDTLCMRLPELPRPLIIKLQLAVVDDLRVKFGKCSLLDIACMGGLSAVASRLSHLMKTSKNKNRSRKNTYVHYAAMCQKGKDIMDIVIKKGQRSINIIGPEGSTPFHYSCAVGNVSIVSYLLQEVVDFGKPNKKGETGLHLACIYGNAEVVKMLLQNKGISHVTDNVGGTPLHDAAWQGHREVVEVLLQNKANVDDKRDDGSTPLHDAAWQGQKKVVEVLLQNKANVDDKRRDGSTPLHNAAHEGHREAVEVLLQNNANVDEKDKEGCTPLHDAAWQGQKKVVEVLLQNKANVDEKRDEGSTPLHNAAWQGHREVVEVLLQNNANVDEKDKEGCTPLHDAAWQGHREVEEVLLQNKANVDEKRDEGSTPLHDAAWQGHREVVEVLLQNNANVDEKRDDGRTPLHHAAHEGHREVVEVLLQNNANVDEKDKEGRTPLHDAAHEGHREAVEVLLQNNANVDEKDKEGRTPLHDAAWQGQKKVVEVLLQNKANVHEKRDEGSTPLHNAAWQGHREAVEVLLQNNANVDEKDKEGRTPLHDAAWQGQKKVVEVLLQNKANVHEKRDEGSTPLHNAAWQGHREVVEVLLQNNANVDEKDKEGRTPLHDAAWQGHREVEEVLLQNKANVDEKRDEGSTPLHHAAHEGHRDAVEVLLQNNANVDEKDKEGRTPLHDAAHEGHREVVEVLLQNNANVDEKRDDGSTPLHHAAHEGHRDAVEVLLQNNANVDEKDKEGRTPLHDAAHEGHREAVEVLLQNNANVDGKRDDGRTPLHLAAWQGQRKVVEVLLQNKANVDEKCDDDRTPLHDAAYRGHRVVVEVLLQNNANVDEKRNDGSTPLHDAAHEGHREVVEVLLQNNANVDEKRDDGRTPLHDAAHEGHRKVVEVLLQNNANVDEKDKEGRTPLHDAAWQGHRDAVEVLLQSNANVNEKRNNGRTPLHDAAYQGHREVVEVLLQNKANVYEKDDKEETALQKAEAQHHDDIARNITEATNIHDLTTNHRTITDRVTTEGQFLMKSSSFPHGSYNNGGWLTSTPLTSTCRVNHTSVELPGVYVPSQLGQAVSTVRQSVMEEIALQSSQPYHIDGNLNNLHTDPARMEIRSPNQRSEDIYTNSSHVPTYVHAPVVGDTVPSSDNTSNSENVIIHYTESGEKIELQQL
ncbi:uncharacterized protein [Haliotis cracherodii]|uniref:uncharacterized protein n=1 Tax=Haliotis cracherodii TaxID=6455 RepID=UPI0039EBDCEF